MDNILFTNEEERLVRAIEMAQTKHDCESIFQLLPFFSAYPELSYGFVPYFSLFSVSVLDFFNKYRDYIDTEETQRIDQTRIKDIRAKLKVFEPGYVKTRKLLLNVDYIQEQDFRRRNQLYSLVHNKQFPNISIHVDDKVRVIGNSQYDYYLMQDKQVLDKSLESIKELLLKNPELYSFEKLGKDSFKLSADCGRIIGTTLAALEIWELPVSPKVKPYYLDVYKADVNTNHRGIFSRNTVIDKSVFLFILHLLSAINFVVFVINECEGVDTGWWLKINYIAYYHLISRLRDFENHINKHVLKDGTNELMNILDLKNEKYLSLPFRNCIMHSSFSFENKSLIDEQHLNFHTPLYGLVETFFPEFDYFGFKSEIIKRLIRISSILTEWLDLRLSTELTREQSKRRWISIDELRSKTLET